MEKMSKAQEQRLVTCMQKIAHSMASGKSPNEAVLEVVKSANLSPEFVKRVTEATNVNITRQHMKTASDLDKAASFPLADSKYIIGELFPNKAELETKQANESIIKQAKEFYTKSETNYNLPASQQKYAFNNSNESSTNFYVEGLLRKAANFVEDRKNLLKEARLNLVSKRSEMLDKIKTAGEYFKFNKQAFTNVESNVLAIEPTTIGLLNTIYKQANLEPFKVKRGSANTSKVLDVDKNTQPYKEIFEAYKCANDLIGFEQDITQLQAVVKQQTDHVTKLAQEVFKYKGELVKTSQTSIIPANQQVVPYSPKPLATQSIKPQLMELTPQTAPVAMGGYTPKGPKHNSGAIKDVLGGLGKGLTSVGEKGTSGIKSLLQFGLGKSKDSGPDHKHLISALSSLADQENHIRSIIAEDNMYRLLSEDNEIKSYNPHQVIAAFNELSQTAPKLVTDLGALKAALRYRLAQGDNISLHDTEQLINIENQIRTRDKVPPLDLWKGIKSDSGGDKH